MLKNNYLIFGTKFVIKKHIYLFNYFRYVKSYLYAKIYNL